MADRADQHRRAQAADDEPEGIGGDDQSDLVGAQAQGAQSQGQQSCDSPAPAEAATMLASGGSRAQGDRICSAARAMGESDGVR